MDMVIAVTNKDEINLMVCFLASKFQVPKRVARLRSMEFTGSGQIFPPKELFLDQAINPGEIIIDTILKILQTPGAVNVAEFAQGKVLLREFDLPENAIRLASSEHYLNQAFQYKSAVGLQFHLEVNEEMVNLWLDNTEEKLQKIPYIDPQKIRSEINENISTVKSNMNNFYNNFKKSFDL